tara:strand:- start:944 stop:2464 length:1521 start_codon:yes stop_codon:yes gene_type:complete
VKVFKALKSLLSKDEEEEIIVPELITEPKPEPRPEPKLAPAQNINNVESLRSKFTDSIKNQIPAEIRIYWDKVVRQNKEPVTSKDFTNKEYNDIKEIFKSNLVKNFKNEEVAFNKKGQLKKYSSYTASNDKDIMKATITTKGKSKGTDSTLKSSPTLNFYKTDTSSNSNYRDVFGQSGYSLKNAPYEEAVATINDIYDFNFEYGGGLFEGEAPGFLNKQNRDKYINMFMDISPLDFIKDGGGVKTLMQIAERYGAFNLPDKKTAERLGKEYEPVNVGVDVPIKDIFTREEWDNLRPSELEEDMGREPQTTAKIISEKYTTGMEKQYKIDDSTGKFKLDPDGEMIYIGDLLVNKTPELFVRDMYLRLLNSGHPFPAMAAAQAGAESRYGVSELALETNNTFGVKVRKGEPFEGVMFDTKEDYGDGKVSEQANFRTYNSLQENINGYIHFLETGTNDDGTPRYAKALAAKTPYEYIQELKNARYATDPNYVKLTTDVYERFLKAGVFD